MSGRPAAAVVVDIEGTTTPVSFVYDVLFPHAQARLRAFLARHADEAGVRGEIRDLRREHAAEPAGGDPPPEWAAGDGDLDSATRYLHWLMDRDRKSTALKALQGRVWEEAFRSGDLRSEVYADVPPAFARWHEGARGPWIFSSGSVLAQRLLFGHTRQGDLSRLIAGYFDTTTGPKKEAATYGRIATAIGAGPGDILFVSDVPAELEAARAAGLRTALCVRGAAPADAGTFAIVRSFDELE